ncbi:hypothetical protein AAG570_003545 [Ranatra chinensis]|uniref:Odorant receptor n=1 Tax=Ranatra chinensis TaxID=642074 RepID=A0ABD0Y406_9HEMI
MEYEDIFYRHTRLLKIFGVSLTAQEPGWLSKIYFAVVVLALAMNSCFQMVGILLPGVSPVDRAKGLVSFFVFSVGGFKIYVLQTKRKELLYLFEKLDLPGARASTYMMRKVRAIHKAYTGCLVLMVFVWIAYPVLVKEVELPVPYWWPSGVASKQRKMVLFCFVTACLAWACGAHESSDTLFLLFAGQICRRFDSINDSLVTLGRDNIEADYRRSTVKPDSMGLAIVKDADKTRDEILLKECIREHVDVIKLVRVLDEVLDIIFFVQVIQSTLVCVMTFFAVFKLGDPLDSIPKFLPILIATYLQFYMYCWMGEEISFHSDDLHKAVYCSQWYMCNRRVMSSIVVMETFTKTHFKLDAGHLFRIGLRTFVLVLEQSFSYFMVLRAITK